MMSFKKGNSVGIEKCHPSELAPDFYKMSNRWSGMVNGQHVMIYAGALRYNPDKGVLVVRKLPTDSRRISGRHCATLATSGALRITEVQGGRLRIAMENGGSFWFEVTKSLRTAA